LDFDIFSQHHPIGHKYILSQTTIFANLSASHHVAKMPDFGASTNLGTFVYNGSGMLVMHTIEAFIH
jgi:hypothetical protein